MEVTISVEMLIKAASLITALSVIGGAVFAIIKFVVRQKKQDEELKAIRAENTLICYGVLACLKGLREQGCNGPVTEAQNRLEKHLNKAAHGMEEA